MPFGTSASSLAPIKFTNTIIMQQRAKFKEIQLNSIQIPIGKKYQTYKQEKAVKKPAKKGGTKMNKKMFCFQCEQTAAGSACTGKAGVCGKKADTAALQDQLTSQLIDLQYPPGAMNAT